MTGDDMEMAGGTMDRLPITTTPVTQVITRTSSINHYQDVIRGIPTTITVETSMSAEDGAVTIYTAVLSITPHSPLVRYFMSTNPPHRRALDLYRTLYLISGRLSDSMDTVTISIEKRFDMPATFGELVSIAENTVWDTVEGAFRTAVASVFALAATLDRMKIEYENEQMLSMRSLTEAFRMSSNRLGIEEYTAKEGTWAVSPSDSDTHTIEWEWGYEVGETPITIKAVGTVTFTSLPAPSPTLSTNVSDGEEGRYKRGDKKWLHFSLSLLTEMNLQIEFDCILRLDKYRNMVKERLLPLSVTYPSSDDHLTLTLLRQHVSLHTQSTSSASSVQNFIDDALQDLSDKIEEVWDALERVVIEDYMHSDDYLGEFG